jgi:glycosyltransferase involved in cell wall biosynthesis
VYNILCFLKVPPPLTGATLMNQIVLESNIINKSFRLSSIEISYTDKLEELGKKSIKKSFAFISTFFSLLKEIIVEKQDLIYFQISPLGLAFYRDALFILIMKLFRKKIIFHLHGQGISKAVKNSYFKKQLYRFVFKDSHIICLSSLLIYDIEDVYTGKPFIVNNAIKSVDIPTRPIKQNRKVTILFLSNLILKKGILDFIDALEILNSDSIEFSAKIIGDEKEFYNNDLRKILIEKKISDKVLLLGPKYDNEKVAEFSKADIFVFPTQYDVWGLVILEAMQASLPVVSTYVGAIPEIVDDGITGFLVEKQSPKDLAGKINLLIRDDKLREKMGKAGRKKFLKKYTLDIFEQNMKTVFDTVLNNN